METYMGLLALICILGGIEPDMPMGFLFVISLVIVLWAALSILQRNKLKGMGLTSAIVGIMTFAYSFCTLFLQIDVRAILAIDALL